MSVEGETERHLERLRRRIDKLKKSPKEIYQRLALEEIDQLPLDMRMLSRWRLRDDDMPSYWRRLVVTELQQADLITSEECRWPFAIHSVVRAQCGKSPEVMAKTAGVLRRHGFEEESRLLEVFAVLCQADLITNAECSWLFDISEVVRAQRCKSPEVVAKTADVLRRHGFEKDPRLLEVLAELCQAGLVTKAECSQLYDISGVVRAQRDKSPEVMAKTADVLRRHGFEKESKLLEVLAELRQAELITSEECKGLSYIHGVVTVQSAKSPEVVAKTADVLRKHGFEKESTLLEVLAELCQADLITNAECDWLFDISEVVRAQRGKSPEVVAKTADVLDKHGFEEESRLLEDCLPHHPDKAKLQHLVDEECSKLFSDYHRLKKSIGAVVKRLPKRSRPHFHHAYKDLSLSARRMCRRPKASKILDARDLRRQIQAFHDPELLQQLSSYEEGSLKPFIATFLDQCRENGVLPDFSQPDVLLSPSTPAGQVLGFILSRKDYYITDLHINRELFSPWDVDTPPPAQAPPTLDGPDLRQHMGTLRTSYAALFTKVVENVESLPRHQYLNLRSFFQFDHTEVHLPFSRRDVRDRLHHTPLFAPLCTALLRKVVWFLFTRDADDLSRQLGDYEEKLGTFVNQFLKACDKEAVVPAPEGVSLNEDGCNLSDPAHLLTCVLELKLYYVGSLCVAESLFTTLQREGSLDGGVGREENGSMDAASLEPTPPTSESESSEKGKHRVGTSPSTVPVKRSVQGEGGEGEEKEEGEGDTAESTAKRRRMEGSHMTSHMTILAKNGAADPQGAHSSTLPKCPQPSTSIHPGAATRSQNVYPPLWPAQVSFQFQGCRSADSAQLASATPTAYPVGFWPQNGLQPVLPYHCSPFVAAPPVPLHYLAPEPHPQNGQLHPSVEDVHPGFLSPALSSQQRETTQLQQMFNSGIRFGLDDKPSLADLDRLIVGNFASRWDQVALHLGIQPCLVEIVKVDNPLQSEKAFRTIFGRWLKGGTNTGSAKRCWRSVLAAIGRSGYRELSEWLRASSEDAAHYSLSAT